MNRLQIFRMLRHHRSLAEKRSLMREMNRVAKFMMYLGAVCMMIYLIMFAIVFAIVANSSTRLTATEVVTAILPFVLAIDFGFRFMLQQTPAQMVRPYILLPLPRNACVDSFVFSSILSTGNLTWFFMLVPYALMSVVFSYGIFTTCYFLLFYLLAMIANSQWYAIVRTLVNQHLAWWTLPVLVYALLFLPILEWGAWDFNIEHLLDVFSLIGTQIDDVSPLPFLVSLLALAVMVETNRRVQRIFVFEELQQKTVEKAPRQFSFNLLNRLGEVGTYLRLEIFLLIRNKNPRKSLTFSVAGVFFISLICAFSDIYDSPFMTNFWGIYNFALFSQMILTRVMSFEGNYIECLMTHKNNIIYLLQAKFILYSLLLVLPFLLMLPTVFTGKWSLLMLVSYGLFTAGFTHFVTFQTAIFNKLTIPLNAKMISNKGMETNTAQLILQFAAMLLPIVVVSLLQVFLSDTVSYIVMAVTGIAFILTQPLWLRSVYNRMMHRRYQNIESFIATR